MKSYIILCLTFLLGWTSLCAQESADTLPQSGVEASASQSDADASATPLANGQLNDELWNNANTAYVNGDFHTAAAIYEQILDRGFSSTKLYYNLANAYFKEDHLGQAILFYHRALRLAPGNDDIRYNLQVAEARTKDNIQDIPEFFLKVWLRDIRHMMGCTAWSTLSLVMLAAMLGLFLLYLLAQRISFRKAGFYGTLLSVFVFALTTWFALGERREMLNDTQAVVMSMSASVKSSPDKSATDLFMLHEGTVVAITDRLDKWCEIVIADGKKGWVEGRMIEVI